MATLPRSFVPDKPVVPKSFVPDEPAVSAADEDIAPDTPERDFGPNRIARNSKGQQVYFDGTIWKDAFTGKQAEGPQQQAATIPGMEKLGALPGVPAPPNPILNPPSDAPEHVRMAYEAKYGTPPETLGTAFREPARNLAGGAGRIIAAKSGKDVAGGARQVIGGATEVMTAPEVMAPAAAMAPVGTALTLGAGATIQKGTEAALKAAGVPEEYAGLAGDVAGLIGAGAVGSRVPQFRQAAMETLREAASKRAFRRSQQPSARGETPKVTEVLPREEAPTEAKPEPITLNAPQIEGPAEAPPSFVPDESPIQGGPLTRVRKVRMPKSFVPDAPPEAVAPPGSRVAPIETPTSGQEVQPVVEPPVKTVEQAAREVLTDPDSYGPHFVQLAKDALASTAQEPAPAENTPSLAAAPPSGGLPETQETPPEAALQSRRVPEQGGAGDNLPIEKPQEPAGETPLQSRPALRLPDRIPASGIILPSGEVHTISGATHEGMAGSKGYKFGDFLRAGGVRYRYNGSDVAMELHPTGIPNAIEFLDTVRPEGRLDIDVSGAEYSGRAPVGALSLNRGAGNRYYGWEDAIRDLRKLRAGKSESTAQHSPAAPLQSKPIEGPAFRPGMSRSAKVTESQVIPARAGREKYPVLHVNAQAMNVLHEAAGMEDGHEIPGVTFTTPQAEELIRTINTELRKARLRNKPAEIAKWEEIRSAIEQNRAQAKGRPLIAVQNGTDVTAEEYATALQEELDHASQLEATGDIYAHHLGPEGTKAFLGTAEGSKAASALRRTYPDVSESQAVMEIGVRLMRPGRFAELGLSPEEARNLRDAYVNALISRHGVERTVRISQKISAAKDREGRVNYGHAGKTTLDARRSGGSERVEAPAAREDGGGSGVRKGGGGGGEGLPPVRSDEGPLQQRKDEGPEFRKKPSAFRVATDFFKPVETRIAQEGPAGKQLKRHLVRAEDVGEVQAGKRVVALRDSGLQDLSREDRQNLVDSLQGFAQPQNAAVQKAFDGIRKVTDEIAAEATAAGVQSKQARTIRPEDPIPPTAKLTQAQKDLRAAGKRIFVQYKRPFQARTNFYPHVIPPPDELRSGDIRRDVADNMVRNGVAANGDEARQMIDEYRKFIDTGERSKKLEAHLVESGQARDENEAHTLLGILRRRVIKRQGSLEYSRQVDLPFYDPDPARVMPKFVTATSLRLAQIREFGQNDEVVNRLIRIIDQTTGNPGFAKMAVDKILAKVNEADTGTARISRAVRAFNGFKLGLSFIPNATQGALNSLLKSDLPSTLAGAKGLMTKEGRRFAMQSGASLEGVVNEMLRSVGADNSALGTFLKGTGFAQTEQANRIWAANAGYAYAKRMLARLQKNPQDGRARKILTELGLKPDVLLRLGKIDGDAALIAAKKFSDITQFRGGIKDLPYFAASPLGKVIFQFKSFVYGQTRLVYDETVQELKEGRPGRAFRTLLLLATVFPLAGEVISDLRTWMKGGERKTSGIKRWLEDIGQAGSLGVIYDMLDAGGWGKGVEFFAGPTLGEAGQVVNIAGGDKKARNAAKWIVKHVPFLGPLFYSRVFPPKEAQSPALKKLTGGSKLRRPKLRTKL